MISRIFLTVVLIAGLLGFTSELPAANYAEHTPGYQSLIEGSRSYKAGQYASAKSKFKQAAYWADKLAQFNLGVMNYHGHGVRQNQARAWAWFELAAERGYPEMVEMARLVHEDLSETQRARGQRILEQELRPEYGDDARVEHVARHMERERRRVTGSRTGFVSGNLQIVDRSGRNRSGDDYFRPEAWDFHQVIELETRVFQALASGKVTLTDLEFIDDDDEGQP
jgi:uncharacterized protein